MKESTLQTSCLVRDKELRIVETQKAVQHEVFIIKKNKLREQKARVMIMKITIKSIIALSKVSSANELMNSKDSLLDDIKSNYDKQYKLRSALKTRTVKTKTSEREIRYSSQDAVQSRVQDDMFIVENIKTSAVSMTRLHDVIEMSKSDVQEFIKYFTSKDFETFRSTMKNISKYVLFTHSSDVLAKHERFYSQCLEQFDYLLNKFYTDCERCRSKNIVVSERTLKRREQEHQHLMSLLTVKSKSKAKTVKAVKSKRAKRVKAKTVKTA